MRASLRQSCNGRLWNHIRYVEHNLHLLMYHHLTMTKHLDQTNCPEYEAFYFKADEVSHLALLALIYRAIPPQNGSSATFSKECIETARAALEKHQQCMALLKETDESLILMYFHWYSAPNIKLLPPLT